ncbi:hypothetical protein, partial [Paenibacillus apii]|uniref:hypothetical protein n=1 Tax=Paenibacillus apii TaxID=1850370 RepID=UPI00197CCC91
KGRADSSIKQTDENFFSFNTHSLFSFQRSKSLSVRRRVSCSDLYNIPYYLSTWQAFFRKSFSDVILPVLPSYNKKEREI